ncbi:MAG: cytoplasmic protein [Anaerolineales bacterium]
MSIESDKIAAELEMDGSNLYREETFTDLKVGSMRKLTPVRTDGAPDETRQVLFVAQTQLLSQMGPLPVSCEIPAETLEEALARYPAAVKQAVERMIDEVKQMQREQASQIVVPGVNPGGRIQLK